MYKIFILLLCFNFLFASSENKLTKQEIQYLETKKTITMCIDPNWMPFEKFDLNKKHTGMTSDYFKLFEQTINIPIKVIQTTTWDQSIQYAKSQKCDILSLVTPTPKRKKYLNFTKPYLKAPLVLVTKNTIPYISDMTTIRNKKIGIIKGYAFGEIIQEKYKHFDIIDVTDINEGLKKVNNDELFGYIDTISAIGHNFQHKFNAQLKIAGKFKQNLSFGIGVRNDDLILLQVLNKAILSLNEKNHQDIFNSWVPIIYETPVNYTLIFQIAFVVLLIVLFFIYKQYMINKSFEEVSEILDATLEIIILHKDKICVDVNHGAVKTLGYESKEELIGINILDLVHNDYKEIVKNNMTVQETQYIEVILIKKDKSTIHVLAYDQDIYNGKMQLSSAIDISTIKKQEKLLFEQSKMVHMGEMIENIAHQWRQPLSVISMSSSSLQIEKDMNTLNDEKFKKYTNTIIDNSEFLSSTIDTFKNYVNNEQIEKSFILQDVINKTISIVDMSFAKQNIKIINNINEIENINIQLIDGTLSQIIINLLNNAKDILLEKEIPDAYIIVSLIHNSNKISITIQDNGGGIPDNIINKIFDPYFTTKHQSQGTGLGLHMSKDIIKNILNGELKVQNINDGALFTIDLKL
jgi:two-component system sensor histidine kinase EvgS